jgi:hypothetical protein
MNTPKPTTWSAVIVTHMRATRPRSAGVSPLAIALRLLTAPPRRLRAPASELHFTTRHRLSHTASISHACGRVHLPSALEYARAQAARSPTEEFFSPLRDRV